MKNLLIPCLAFSFALISLGGCIPEEVDIDIPQADFKLVVASQLFSDQFLVVNVSRSFSSLESTTDTVSGEISDNLLDRLLVDSALVTVAIGTDLDTLMGLGGGVYISTQTTFVAGQTYTLKVFDPATGESVASVEKVLPLVPLGNLNYAFDIVETAFNDTVYRDTVVNLAFDFEDPGETNYYLLNAYRLRFPDSTALTSLFSSASNVPVSIYSDQRFTSSTFRDTLSYSAFGPGDTIAVTLANISKTYYDFLSVRQRSGTNIFTQLLKEPISYPSNVAGGYGIFNLYLPSIQILILR